MKYIFNPIVAFVLWAIGAYLSSYQKPVTDNVAIVLFLASGLTLALHYYHSFHKNHRENKQ